MVFLAISGHQILSAQDANQTSPTTTATPECDCVPNEILLKLKSTASDDDKKRIFAIGVVKKEYKYATNLFLLKITNGLSIHQAIDELQNDPAVDSVSPNDIKHGLDSSQQKNQNDDPSLISTTIQTCVPTVIPGTISFQPGHERYCVIRNQGEWEKYVNNPDKQIAPINFDKQMLVNFPFSTIAGQNLIHIQVSSACVLSDHIQINYSVAGYRNPPSRSKIIHYRPIAVVLPQSNLPVSVLCEYEPTPTLVPTP